MDKTHKIVVTVIAAQTVLLAALILGVYSLLAKPVVKTVTKVEKVIVTPVPTPKLLVSPKEKLAPTVASKAANVK